MAAVIPIAIAAVATWQQHQQANAAEGDAKANRRVGYDVADANETRVRASSAQKLGEQRAAAAESGFDANTGSLATVQSQSAGNAELDALTQRYQGQLTAWRAQQEINNAKSAKKPINALANFAGAYFGGVQGAQLASQVTSRSGGSGGGSYQSAYGQLLNSSASYG